MNESQVLEADRRFAATARLRGAPALARLARSHAVVAGMGGVGSWAAEALVRTGVGSITIIDLDHIAESNVTRQVHALEATLRGVLAGLEDPSALAPRLAAVRVPALVVVGADDKESLEPSRELAANIPGAEFVIVPDAGHVVNLKQPAVFNELARRFIERVKASSAAPSR